MWFQTFLYRHDFLNTEQLEMHRWILGTVTIDAMVLQHHAISIHGTNNISIKIRNQTFFQQPLYHLYHYFHIQTQLWVVSMAPVVSKVLSTINKLKSFSAMYCQPEVKCNYSPVKLTKDLV